MNSGFLLLIPATIPILLILQVIIETFKTVALKGKDPLAIWTHLSTRPILTRHFPSFKSFIFSLVLSQANPFSSALDIRIQRLEKGKVEGTLGQKRSNMNPFGSIHACALALLAETVGGLAMFTVLEKKDRVIVSSIECRYLKKCRGLVCAIAQNVSRPSASGQYVQTVEIYDANSKGKVQDLLVDCKITWDFKLLDQ